MSLLEIDPVSLPTPDGGGQTMRHDAEFERIDGVLCEIRDTVNRGIGILEQVGINIRRLPEGSLEELLVRPLTGDYVAIRQNAAAAHVFRDGLSVYGGNVVRLSLAVNPMWGGQAAGSFLVRLGGQAAVARSLGEIVARGSFVFDELADFSERITIRVEDLVAELMERGGRVLEKLVTRVFGPGVARLVVDVALNGFDIFTDIIEDIERILAIIDDLMSMRDEVSAWVAEQRERLDLLMELRDVVLRGGW